MKVTEESEGMGVSTAIARQSKKGHTNAFSALRQRNFRLFWTGQLISLIGTWMVLYGAGVAYTPPDR